MSNPSLRIKNPTSLDILIIGAGCAGPALALTLQKTNPKHNITVIERFASLRTGGQQIDLKENGVHIARSLGILRALKDVCVKETGMQFVDTNGTSLMKFGINDASKQGLALTNEYEIMRGDMVKVFYDGSIAERNAATERGEKEGSLTYKFNTTITQLDQSESGATVTFSDGQKTHYDLVVAADGQGSRTRRMVFGDQINAECFKPLGAGVHAAYFEIPRIESDDSDARVYFAPGSRMVVIRTGDRATTQVYFIIMKDTERHERMRGVNKLPVEKQKEAWTEIFHDAGWQCTRFVEGLKATKDFYAHEVGQIHMPQLYNGRVVLLGDAGYCPSPFTGMGTTLSLVGSYILAGELAKHNNDVDAALQAYHELMQPATKHYQKLMSPGNFYPSSKFGIMIANNIMWILYCLRVDKLLGWIGERSTGSDALKLPTYPELSLVAQEKL